MRTDNNLNDEDRLMLNNLKVIAGYVFAASLFGLTLACMLIIILK